MFRLEDGSVRAVDNRCPHEGWPLVAGSVGGTVLTLATCDEAEALADRRPLAAAVRFLASPKNERRTGQRISEAIALVRDGRPPRVLAV